MTMSVIIPPDAVEWATGWLRSALASRSEPYAADVFVSASVPNPRRDRMVIFRRDGGYRMDVVRTMARLTVNVWATSEQEVSALARLTEGLLLSAADGVPVLRVTQASGPSPVPDAQPRRLMSFEVIVRGQES